MDAARKRTEAELTGFSQPTHAEIVRDAVAWNTLYEPIGERVVTTVSRLWNVQKRGGFAMFCWDAFFGALLAGVHSTRPRPRERDRDASRAHPGRLRAQRLAGHGA